MAFDAEVEPVSHALLILRGARQRIAHGWTRLRFRAGERMCLVAALESARSEVARVPMDENYLAIEQTALLAQLGLAGVGHAISFNDSPMTTKAAVLARLDLAIAKLEGACHV